MNHFKKIKTYNKKPINHNIYLFILKKVTEKNRGKKVYFKTSRYSKKRKKNIFINPHDIIMINIM